MFIKNPTNETLEITLTENIRAFIQSKNKNIPLNQPVYAVNWFNTRALWLYNLYNWLAIPSIRKIKGKPFFKGHVSNVLYGPKEHRRDVLLIVYYPTASAFKHMLESRYFKLVSLLRMLAVREFTFAFSSRTDHPTLGITAENQQKVETDQTDKVYALHHYQAKEDITEIVADAIEGQSLTIYFSSFISARLWSGDQHGPNKQQPCLMDGVVLLQADNQAQLEHTLQQEKYKTLIQLTESSFVCCLNRLM